ncbi:MAG TPA: hypothetical protein PLZ93_24395 [Nocardioides sp.]|nr:hypothetical protein [uncultured Nocardioides sp.]HRD64478.1 hypothetical protein [Nocardioides sp.]HRI98788.1 hypothetical protein [Nocardioides sp.]
MYNTFDTYQAEIEYRANRFRKDVNRKGRRGRSSFGRKSAQATRTTS